MNFIARHFYIRNTNRGRPSDFEVSLLNALSSNQSQIVFLYDKTKKKYNFPDFECQRVYGRVSRSQIQAVLDEIVQIRSNDSICCSMYEDYLFFTFMLFMILGVVTGLCHTHKQLQTRENWMGKISIFLIICVLLLSIIAIFLAFKRYFEEKEIKRLEDISFCIEQYNKDDFYKLELFWESGPLAAWLKLRLLYMRPLNNINLNLDLADSNTSVDGSNSLTLTLTDELLI